MRGERQTLCGFFMLILLVLVVVSPRESFAALELYLSDGETLHTDGSLPAVAGRIPVLFIHGHNSDDDQDFEDDQNNPDTDFNFRKNWRQEPANLTSFRQTLENQQNLTLGIEPYYIRFQDQHRSIVEDAKEIAEAINWILERHDPNFDSGDAASRTPVQVVIIAYSKGTISSRYYLKGLRDPTVSQELAMLTPRSDFFPVSEFIAIAPPNHGLRGPFLLTLNLSGKQLNNGYQDDCDCFRDFPNIFVCEPNDEEFIDFIERLNGHDIEHSLNSSSITSTAVAELNMEAPGSRADGAAPTTGTLYLSLYADQNRDFVGGHTPRNPADCQGRVMAKNLASDAENIELNEISNLGDASDAINVHRNTVHTPEVICLALYTAVHHRTPLNVPACRSLTAGQPPVVPAPPRAAAMLALDMSGSMSTRDCPTCEPRHVILKQAVELFVQLWTLLGSGNDYIGVTYFRDVIDELEINSEFMFPLLANAQDVIDDIISQTPSSRTAMGGALASAINRLQALPSVPEEHARRVILFTDGRQNVAPLVQEYPGMCIGAACNYRIAGGVELNSSLGIAIDTIAIDFGGLYSGLLSGISEKTNGNSLIATTFDDISLREFFVNTLINSLRGFSPQLVAYRRNALTTDEMIETFRVNQSARKLVLKLSWHTGQSLDFKVTKDGQDLTALGTIIDGPFYRIYALDLPANRVVSGVQVAGDWQMHITGDSGAKYEAAAIVDEHLLKYQAILKTKRMITGDPLELEVRLLHEGRPITDAEVTATVLRPGQSLGTLLSQSPNPKAPPEFQVESGTSVGQRKLELLRMDKDFWAKLAPVTERVTLRHQGAGRYTVVTKATTVPGTYQAVINIKGEAEEIGSFVRSETLTTQVSFAHADFELSDLKIQELTSTKDGRKLRLSLRPKDKLGNFLGPDYASHIHLTLAEGTVAKEIIDHTNGRYDINLNVPIGSDPVLTIIVLGESLFTGALSELEQNSVTKLWLYLLLAFVVVVFLGLWLRRRRQLAC